MGYQPGKGLGKELQGISAPVEAHLRKGRGAIGAYGKERAASIAVVPAATEDEADVKEKSQWRKAPGEKKKVNYTYQSVEDIIERGKLKSQIKGDSKLSRVKVIDMTGKEQRVFSGYHAIHASQRMPDEARTVETTNFALPELLHNLDLLTDMCEQDIIRLDRTGKTAEDRSVALEHEEEQLSRQIENEQLVISRLEQLIDTIDKLETGSVTVDEAYDLLGEVKEQYSDEFEHYNLAHLAIPFVFPLVKKELQVWQPLENPDYGRELFFKWRTLLESTMGGSLGSAATDVYHQLVWECWMPRVRAIMSVWKPRECKEVIDLLEHWTPLLPEWIMENILDQLVLPRLQKEVSDWNPLTDTVPIHAWIHPWLPLMGHRLETCYPPIRQKLSSALTAWHPSDRSAMLIIAPWIGVWTAGTLEAFLMKNIVPKLQLAMQELVINPQSQSLEQWKWVMEWKDVLPTSVLAGIMDSYFFPRWLQVLATWLNHSPSYDEVTKWYLGWKSLVPENLLSNNIIKEHLRTALEMMQRAVGQPGTDNLAYIKSKEKPHSPAPNTDIESVTARSSASIPQGFKELFQRRCEEKGIVFMPIPNKYYMSKQVYQCGNLHVYMDRSVLFIQQGNTWQPTAIHNVLDMAEK